MTTVRVITSRVDIVWSSDGVEFKKEQKSTSDYITLPVDIYSSSYIISQLMMVKYTSVR